MVDMYKYASRLSGRVGLTIVPLVVIVTVIMVAIYDRNQYRSAMQQAEQTLENDARLFSEKILSEVERLKYDVDLISEIPSVQGLIRSEYGNGVDPFDGSTTRLWRARLGKVLEIVARKSPEYDQLRYIGIADGGREVVRINRIGDRVELVPSEKLQQKENREYFQSTIKLSPGQIYLSDINLNRDFGKITSPSFPTLRIAKPVFSKQGNLHGMVVLNRKVEPLFEELEKQLPRGIEFYITNEQGDYLYHPDKAKRFGFDLGKPYKLTDDFSQLGEMLAGNPAMSDAHLDMDVDGTTYKLVYQRIAFDPLNESRYLGIVLTIPHDRILEIYDEGWLRNILLIVGLGLVIIVTTYVLLQRITRPLHSLASSAQRIAEGNYDIEIPDTGSLELEELAEALRHAANDVAQRERSFATLNKELEQRVQDRTNKLRQRERSLVNAQRIAGLGSWEWDVEKNQLNWSDEMYRIFKLNPEEHQPSYWIFHSLIHPDDRPKFEEKFTDALKHSDGFALEYRLICPGEREHVVSCEGEVTRDENGRATYVQGTVLDITERKKTEAGLRLLASVFAHSPDGILITDDKMNILEVNPAFSTITGYTPEDALGKTPRILSSGLHDKQHYQAIWRSLSTTGHWQGEMTDRRKNGESYTEWLTISSVHDSDNRLVNYVGVFKDITEKKAAEQRITHLAYYDFLTELANRRLFEDRLEQTLRLARRKDRSVALLYIDLDRFKPINDSLGHKAGDLLLIQVARRLQEEVRESDTVARLGGDEFGIVLDSVTQVSTSHIAKKIIGRIGDAFDIEGNEVFIGASIGISMFPNDGTDLNALMKHADIAMYRAKEQGRNNYQFFLPVMNAGAEERMVIENALRYAVEREELEVYYQPQVRLSDGEIVGVEALLRWRHPDLGTVSPARFIPIAEETGLIGRLGEWVLEQACRQRQFWEGEVADGFRVAVNLSARQFNTNIVGMVEAVLSRTGIAAGNLELEITESMVMEDSDSSVELLNSLSALGVHLAMDDFGTGYSSLGYLKRFPLHKLKVDRAFITGLPDDEGDAAITKAVIAMAKSLGLRVIAEGTETLDQIRFLQEIGCDEVQGYYCSRPLPADELFGLLQKGVCQRILE